MIYLNLNLRNPWGKDNFKSIKTWHGSTFVPNKYWEVQVIRCYNFLRFEFAVTMREDHAGVNLELGLFGYEIHFTVYDNRHWDYDNNCWVKYEEDQDSGRT